MASLAFDKQIAIRADSEQVYAELANPARHIGLQPLLVEVDERAEAADDAARVFIAVEAVPLALGCTIRNRIEVRLERTRPGEIVEFEARSRPGVRVRSRFTLSSEGDHTRDHERVRIVEPRLLRAFVAARAEAAQEPLLRNLKRRLEADRTTA
jgi:hypothetical protein